MSKKKKTKISLPFVKFILPVLLSGFLILFMCRQVYLFLTRSDLFTIHSIQVDPSLHFIQSSSFERIKGKNIFTIDLAGIQKKLAYRYPQVKRLRIVRHFPDQISIEAQERPPFAQTLLNEQLVTFDKDGVILSLRNKRHGNLPFLEGIPSQRQHLTLGFSLTGNEIRMALRIMKSLMDSPTVSSYEVEAVNVKNLSQIEVVLSNKIAIYLDKYNYEKQIKILAFLLSEKRFDLQTTKYIDLRFKEPVIGKK